MKRSDLTRAALADLKSIARYTWQRRGVRQRNSCLKVFDQVFCALAKNPLIGQVCEELREGYRKFPHGSHVIHYKLRGKEGLLVVRILHMTMEVDFNIGD